MYSPTDLKQEIAAKIEWLQANNGRILHPDAITDALMGDHAAISGEDADFHTCCSRSTVRDEVRRMLNRFDIKAEDRVDPQIILAGFERLQCYYMTIRAGDRVAVRVDDMTAEELDAKEAELDAIAAGCMLHKGEIRRYRESKYGLSPHDEPSVEKHH